jgi:EspG family
MLEKPLTLHVEALVRLTRMENLGDLHVTLKPQAVWRRKSDQDLLEVEARKEFMRLGLLDNRGRVDVEIAASLAVLCRAGAEFYGWINEGDKTRGVLAGAIGREAVLAIRDGDEVKITQIKPETLPMALVSQTPDVPPSRGEAVNVLRSDMLATSGGRQRTAAGVGMRPAPPEVRILQRIIAQPTTGGGELYVAIRDRVGRRKSVPDPLRYADTETGRWLNHTTNTSDGEQRILVAPATRADLAARLQEMHRNLSR